RDPRLQGPGGAEGRPRRARGRAGRCRRQLAVARFRRPAALLRRRGDHDEGYRRVQRPRRAPDLPDARRLHPGRLQQQALTMTLDSIVTSVNVIISGGFSLAYREALPEFERTTGIAVATASAASQG